MDRAPNQMPAWDQLAAHREHLLLIASRRASSPEAAEDAVQEALARAAARWHLIDPDQLGAWLAVVTMNLCADDHRRRSRERRVLPRLCHTSAPDPADLVSQQLEDAWVVEQVGELPDRQRQMLHAVADEGGVPAAAHRMGVSRQSAESLLKRARATVRARIAVTLGALGLAGWRRGARVGTATGGAAAGMAAVSLGLLATVPGVFGGGTPPDGGRGPGHTLLQPHRVQAAASSTWLGPRAHHLSSATVHPGLGVARDGAATRSDRRQILAPTPDVKVGPVKYHDNGGVYEANKDETPVEAVHRCLEKGVVVSSTYIGCKKPNA
jgi:RNA polymerase sigma factor (sigma-70 family)